VGSNPAQSIGFLEDQYVFRVSVSFVQLKMNPWVCTEHCSGNMDRRIGIILVVISLLLGAMAVVDKTNTDNLINEFSNQTGSCYVEGTCLHEQTTTTFIILAIVAAALAIIGAVIIILSDRKTTDKKEAEDDNNRTNVKHLTLGAEQKKIYDALVESGGSMLQGELVEKTGMNKVTVSRILDKLEMHGLIERRRHGMSNIVIIKKK